MIPRRIQMTRARPWRAEHPEAVIVARPTKWGNPFVVGECWRRDDGDTFVEEKISDRQTALRFFEDMLRYPQRPYPSAEEIRTELRGRDLACWCPLDGPCHADVLLRIANEED